MDKEQIKDMQKMVKKLFPQVGAGNLTALKEQGSFGLLDLDSQLLGRRVDLFFTNRQ